MVLCFLLQNLLLGFFVLIGLAVCCVFEVCLYSCQSHFFVHMTHDNVYSVATLVGSNWNATCSCLEIVAALVWGFSCYFCLLQVISVSQSVVAGVTVVIASCLLYRGNKAEASWCDVLIFTMLFSSQYECHTGLYILAASNCVCTAYVYFCKWTRKVVYLVPLLLKNVLLSVFRPLALWVWSLLHPACVYAAQMDKFWFLLKQQSNLTWNLCCDKPHLTDHAVFRHAVQNACYILQCSAYP